MKALVLNAQRSLELADRPVPEMVSGTDVLVRIHQTGICGTDRGVLLGKVKAAAGTVMGHEGVGTVAATGPAVTTLAVGDRVIINPTMYCGRCDACLRGRLNFCLRKAGTEVGIDRDGSFAEYIALDEIFVPKIPDGMSFDTAALVEPLACVLSNLLKADLTAGDHVLVLGGGPIGLLAAMTARYLGSPVTLAEQDEFRRKFAAEVLTGSFGAGVSVIADAGGLSRFAAVVDTVGSQLASALPRLDDGGTVVVMGFDATAEATVRPLEIVQRGLRIIGAGDYHSQIFRRAIDVAAMLPLSKLITHRFRLDEHEAAFGTLAWPDAEAYSAVKVVIEGRVQGKAGEVAA